MSPGTALVQEHLPHPCHWLWGHSSSSGPPRLLQTAPRSLLAEVFAAATGNRCLKPFPGAVEGELLSTKVWFYRDVKPSTLLRRCLSVHLSEEGFCIRLLQGGKSLWSGEGDALWEVRTLLRREERVDLSACVTVLRRQRQAAVCGFRLRLDKAEEGKVRQRDHQEETRSPLFSK